MRAVRPNRRVRNSNSTDGLTCFRIDRRFERVAATWGLVDIRIDTWKRAGGEHFNHPGTPPRAPFAAAQVVVLRIARSRRAHGNGALRRDRSGAVIADGMGERAAVEALCSDTATFHECAARGSMTGACGVAMTGTSAAMSTASPTSAAGMTAAPS